MTHHFDPAFMGTLECNNCGYDFLIDELNSDLLCPDCEKRETKFIKDIHKFRNLAKTIKERYEFLLDN